MEKPFSTYFKIVTWVVGACLVLKVFIIEIILDLDVNVLDLWIPGILEVFYEIVRKYTKKNKQKEFRQKVLHPVPWTIGIVVITAISIWVYQL